MQNHHGSETLCQRRDYRIAHDPDATEYGVISTGSSSCLVSGQAQISYEQTRESSAIDEMVWFCRRWSQLAARASSCGVGRHESEKVDRRMKGNQTFSLVLCRPS